MRRLPLGSWHNFLIAPTIEGVRVDGAAFNVREGNNSIDVAASYLPRQRVTSFLQLTGDYRDGDVMAGWGSANPQTDAWIAGEFSAMASWIVRSIASNTN
ncbi:MAG: hypothetical protein P4M04_03420 [Acidobacteriota bacterium]|nr:hypothetical protein [Acidobacteriota bacterium]